VSEVLQGSKIPPSGLIALRGRKGKGGAERLSKLSRTRVFGGMRGRRRSRVEGLSRALNLIESSLEQLISN
jgi:hypothetical protein